MQNQRIFLYLLQSLHMVNHQQKLQNDPKLYFDFAPSFAFYPFNNKSINVIIQIYFSLYCIINFQPNKIKRKLIKMQKSYLSQKMGEKPLINPEETNQLNNKKTSLHSFKPQQSSPLPEQRILSNEQFNINLNANSSTTLNITQQFKNFISLQSYRLNQSYFTKQELIQQENFNKIIQEDFIYYGGLKNGMKHGLGILITKSVTYQGNFSLNHKNGKGFIQYPNKSKYFGDFSNDKPHGHGMLQYGTEYYIGDFQNGTMNGDGLWKNQKGEKYIGKWKTNKAHGYGIYVTQKSHYQGQFSNFQKNGYGIQNFVNGDIYKGYYLHGKPNGLGEYTWSNGATYKGNFNEGMREGQGLWINEIGDTYEGSYKGDRKNGYGTFTWANGNLYKGQFSQDMRDGQGEMVWNDGSTYEGQWARGLPNGKGLYRAKGQKPKHGIFQDNVLVEQMKHYSIPKSKRIQEYNNNRVNSKSIYNIQKSKLYLNMIPEFPKKRNLPQSRSFNRRTFSLNKTAASTMNTFKNSINRNPLSWRNK